MTGRVVRDYFTAFRWSNVRACMKASHWFVFVYIFICIPLFECIVSYGWKIDLVRILVPAGMAMFVVFTAPLHPVTMPKIMFLCPLSREQRREYVRKAWLFKIAVPIVMTVFSMTVLGACGKMEFFRGIQITVTMSVLAISTSMAERGAEKSLPSDKERRNVWEMTGDGWIVAAVIMFSVIMSLMIAVYGGGESISETDVIVIGVGCAVVELPLAIQVLRRIIRKLAVFTDYEYMLRSNGGKI